VIAHEIAGPTIGADRLRTARDCDIYTPNLLADPRQHFAPDQHEAAYASFMSTGGVTAMATRLSAVAERLRPRYRKVCALGFSVGATSAWIAASRGVFDTVVGIYGSRIRDHADLVPTCPCLLLFAAREPSFAPRDLIGHLAGAKNVTTVLYECGHGFCDPAGPNYDASAAEHALTRATEFLLGR
jgi:dienelactone hydrolase